MRAYDEICCGIEAIFSFAARPFRQLLKRVDRYMLSNETSLLGQTLIVCSPMLIALLLVCIAIDLR